MRGVNKLIVEIKDTENDYFDRAILFLRPDKVMTDQAEINKNAQKLLTEVHNNGVRHKDRKKLWIGIAVGLLTLGIGIALILAF
ncbi:MAG: hypothetical protein NC203_11795 [Firmicutes bacterium]|nr:hypothetical protein [[Eubacterium] siraeum]MCM1489035.1 hypothetical protein [Bacillota bacterium]